MAPIVAIHDKETGQKLDEAELQARHHVTNYQAMITWRGIVKMGSGDSMDAAVQDAFDKFSGLAVLSEYDIRLLPGGY